MARPEKEAAVRDIVEILKSARGVFVTDYKGLDVEQMTELRNKCRENSVKYRVIKNTLAGIAAKEIGFDEMVEYFKGPSALAYSYDDPSAPARVVTAFAKKADKPTIKMSIFEGVFYGQEKVNAIASLPSLDELYSKLIGSINSPLQGLVGCLNGILRKFVMTLSAIRESKEDK